MREFVRLFVELFTVHWPELLIDLYRYFPPHYTLDDY
jgi:hypothetical protein